MLSEGGVGLGNISLRRVAFHGLYFVVDSDLIKAQKRQDILGLLGVMENTMEYTVVKIVSK